MARPLPGQIAQQVDCQCRSRGNLDDHRDHNPVEPRSAGHGELHIARSQAFAPAKLSVSDLQNEKQKRKCRATNNRKQ